MKKNFVFGTIASLLCLYNTSANARTCPTGCFCLNDGEVHTIIQEDLCTRGGAHRLNTKTMNCNEIYTYGDTTIIRDKLCMHCPNCLFVEDFSEIYVGDFGWYGYKNNQFLYGYHQAGTYATNAVTDALVCPSTYPNSDPGASTLTQCYKYDANGNKKYYKRLPHTPKPTPNTISSKKSVATRAAQTPKKIIYKEVIFDETDSTIDEDYDDFEMLI